MYMEDIIKANINRMFPAMIWIAVIVARYLVTPIFSWMMQPVPKLWWNSCVKKVKKRKIGAVCRFVYDRKMPADYLEFLVDAFGINRDDLVPGDKHLNLEDLAHLPNPSKELCTQLKPRPMTLNCLDEKESIFRYVSKKDLMLHFPYHSFEHFIHFLYEAVHDPSCKEIMITQYRVAENSVVINTLIAAAQNGKKVTVFVELKARFDEENNLATAR